MPAKKTKKPKKPMNEATVDIARTTKKPFLVVKVDPSSKSFYRLHARGGT